MDSPALPVASCAVVLSSGGIDSTTCLALAVKRFGAENVTALGVSYGQKHVRELESAQAVAKHYQVAQHVLDLSNALAASTNALMARSSHPIEHESYGQQIQGREEGPVSTYVPFRNGLMLSAAAAFALSIYPDRRVLLYLGAHADDAAGSAYPDCSAEFVDTMGRAIELGTYGLARSRRRLSTSTRRRGQVRPRYASTLPSHLVVLRGKLEALRNMRNLHRSHRGFSSQRYRRSAGIRLE